jgi:hypothetical protein
VGLIDSPLCRRCGAEEETSAHVMCECGALDSLRLTYLGSFCLDPEDVRSLSVGLVYIVSQGTGLPWLGTSDYGDQRACQKGLCASGLKGLIPIYCSILFCSNVFYSTSRHSITSEKSWTLIGIAVRTSAVGFLFFPHKIWHFPLNDHEKEDISLKKEVKKQDV